jgi:hypothetical protein
MSNGGDMFDPHCPLGRLFYVLLVVLMALPSSQAQSPGTTTISEVRWSDAGWGPDNDRNLVGRFSTQSLVLPRLTKVQNYFLRQYDSSVPPRYSRYTTALHLDYPL